MQNLIKFVSLIFSWNKKHRRDVSFIHDIHAVCASAVGEGFSYSDGLSDQISRLVSARHVASLKTQLSLQFEAFGTEGLLHSFVAALRECCRQGCINRDQESSRTRE